MSLTLDPVTISPGASVAVPVQNPNSVQTIIISNKAYIDAVVTGIDNAGPRWLIAGTQDRFDAPHGTFNGSVVISGFNTANIPSTQVSVVLLTVYYDGDEVPTGSWPVSIPSQVVNNSVAVSSSIANDANAAGTSIIETTIAGQASSNQTATNDGIWNLSIIIAGAIVQWLKTQNVDPIVQLGAAAHTTKILGTLDTAGILSSTGKVQLGISTAGDILDTAGGTTFLKGSSAIQMQTSVGTVASADSTGWNTPNGVNFNIGRIKDFRAFTGTGNGTFSHGLSGTPQAVVIWANMVGGSQTVSSYNYTGTQFTVTTGASGSWAALAYR